MNIFLKVLKQLIVIELNSAATKQNNKSQGYFYKKQLSADQLSIINELNEKIIRFESNEGDKFISEAVTLIIHNHYELLRKVRGEHKEDKDKGETIKCLVKLKSYVPEFHKKLLSFKFNLLDRPFTEMPEGIVYFHAAVYLGEEIFSPKKIMDRDIREDKEACLYLRLKQLSEYIKPNYTFEERKERTAQVLIDLGRDNEEIIVKANAKNYISLPLPISGPSLLGMKLSLADVVGCGLGRFSEQFNEAVRKIDRLTPKPCVESKEYSESKEYTESKEPLESELSI